MCQAGTYTCTCTCIKEDGCTEGDIRWEKRKRDGNCQPVRVREGVQGVAKGPAQGRVDSDVILPGRWCPLPVTSSKRPRGAGETLAGTGRPDDWTDAPPPLRRLSAHKRRRPPSPPCTRRLRPPTVVGHLPPDLRGSGLCSTSAAPFSRPWPAENWRRGVGLTPSRPRPRPRPLRWHDAAGGGEGRGRGPAGGGGGRVNGGRGGLGGGQRQAGGGLQGRGRVALAGGSGAQAPSRGPAARPSADAGILLRRGRRKT